MHRERHCANGVTKANASRILPNADAAELEVGYDVVRLAQITRANDRRAIRAISDVQLTTASEG
jgi:hypothetical protein